MKPTHIKLNEAGQIVAFVMPITGSYADIEDYYEAIKIAIKDGMVFKDEDEVKQIIKADAIERWLNQKVMTSVIYKLEQGKVYDVPEGYEVKIEEHCPVACDCRDEETMRVQCQCQYAVLVPKQEPVKKDCSCTGPWDCQCQNVIDAYYGNEKQPTSIEEAGNPPESYWNDYWKNVLNLEDCSRNNKRKVFQDAFLLAKDYWFEQFKQEKK